MFKAIECDTEQEIILLDASWNQATLEVLREKGRENKLMCPVCLKPVRVKAGEIKRWHFAHQDLSQCPLRSESPTILHARSLLYAWLLGKFPGQVTIEKIFPHCDLPRPVDCYVEVDTQHTFAYWLLETAVRTRDSLLALTRQQHLHIYWIFLSNMLKAEAKNSSNTVHLTPTEREFCYRSHYNAIYSSHNAALNYFDIGTQHMTTLRGLHCIHTPQYYAFHARLEAPLEELLISSKTGECIYRGEYERLQAYKKRQQKLAQKHEEQRKQREHQRQQRARHQQQSRQEDMHNHHEANEKRPEEQAMQTQETGGEYKERPSLPRQKPSVPHAQTAVHPPLPAYLTQGYTCRICGKHTEDWVELDLSTNICICSRECLQMVQKKSGEV